MCSYSNVHVWKRNCLRGEVVRISVPLVHWHNVPIDNVWWLIALPYRFCLHMTSETHFTQFGSSDHRSVCVHVQMYTFEWKVVVCIVK